MASNSWERLVALVPAPSQSVAGRQIEAAYGTLTQVKSFLTQEALASCMTRAQQNQAAARFAKPKRYSATPEMHRLHPSSPAAFLSKGRKWGTAQIASSAILPPLPGQKKKYSVPSRYQSVYNSIQLKPEEEEYMRQERAQISAWRLGSFYTWGGRIRHHHPPAQPRTEFYNEHVPGKLVPLRL
eukprot:jgi/Ulvmu1/12521/UM090_0008.1